MATSPAPRDFQTCSPVTSRSPPRRSSPTPGCPHAYFVSRLLGVQPVEEPENIYEISPMEIGNFMHEVLDELIKEFSEELPGSGQPWTSAQRVRMREIAAAKAEEFERTGRTGHARLWRRAHERILADLEWMLDDDDAWRAEVGAAVVASELPFGKDGHEPVAVAVPGGHILMRGSADKVDVGADGTIYVTDLKTGGRSSFKDIKQEDPIVGGTKLQLPIYALAARERFGTTTSPVARGVLVRAQGPRPDRARPDARSRGDVRLRARRPGSLHRCRALPRTRAGDCGLPVGAVRLLQPRRHGARRPSPPVGSQGRRSGVGRLPRSRRAHVHPGEA